MHVTPMPGRVLLKGSKIVSPFADSPDVVLEVVRDWCRRRTSSARGTLTPTELALVRCVSASVRRGSSGIIASSR